MSEENTPEYKEEFDEEFEDLESMEAFEQADPSIAFNAVENAPQPDEDQYPRYAMSGLLPIPLYRQHGNNSFGDFNKKNERGITVVNYNWYPAFTFMPLLGGTFEIPYENQPTLSQEPVTPAPFDYNSFKTSPRNGYSRLTRNPKQCADLIYKDYHMSGVRILDSLIGYRIADPDKGVRAAKELVELILPWRDHDVFPEQVRIKNGVVFKGPFLDDMLDFVVKHSLQRLKDAGYALDPESVPVKLHANIRKVLSDGTARANTILNETEAELKNPNEIKKTYDPPVLDVYDAPVSTDLYCLAHTNRTEIDEKQLKASENIGRGMADPLTKAVEVMTDTLRRGGLPANVPAGKDVMTIDQVEELLKRQRQELTNEFDAKLIKALAVGQTVEEIAGNETVDNKGKKK